MHIYIRAYMVFPGGSEAKNLPANAVDEDLIPGKSIWRRKWQPTPVFWTWEIPWTEKQKSWT